jgi:hypothetical protein
MAGEKPKSGELWKAAAIIGILGGLAIWAA